MLLYLPVYWFTLALPVRLPSAPNVAVMALDVAGDCSAPLPLLMASASHTVSVSVVGWTATYFTSAVPQSSVSVSVSAVTVNCAAFSSAEKYSCSCAMAFGGPAMSVAAGCEIVILSPLPSCTRR